jgi:hypothetical protein
MAVVRRRRLGTPWSTSGPRRGQPSLTGRRRPDRITRHRRADTWKHVLPVLCGIGRGVSTGAGRRGPKPRHGTGRTAGHLIHGAGSEMLLSPPRAEHRPGVVEQPRRARQRRGSQAATGCCEPLSSRHDFPGGCGGQAPPLQTSGGGAALLPRENRCARHDGPGAAEETGAVVVGHPGRHLPGAERLRCRAAGLCPSAQRRVNPPRLITGQPRAAMHTATPRPSVAALGGRSAYFPGGRLCAT